MDAHDAIFEQLQRAQQRALEALTNRLGFVAESLDKLAVEAKASLEEAVPEAAEELFPVAEISAAIAALQERAAAAEARVGELEEQLAEPPEAVPTVPLDLLRAMDAARSQSELLRELLPRLADSAARAVVFVLRGGEISAWSGIGVTDGEQLRTWRAAVDASPVFVRFTEQIRPIHFLPGDDPVMGSWLAGEEMPIEALILPVCLRGKLMGGIYVDHVAERPWQPDAAQAMVALTCWMIDTLHHRQTVPSPMLAEPMRLVEPPPSADEAVAETAGATPEAEAPSYGAEDEAEPTPEWAAAPAVEADAELEAAAETEVDAEPAAAMEEPTPTAELEPAVEPAPEAAEEHGEVVDTFDPSATVRVDMAHVAPAVEEAEPETFDEAEAEIAYEAVPEAEPEAEPAEPPPVSPVVPPPPLAAPAEISPEDEARHEEARRFARLLVSEIKLYNEDEVEQGRAEGDLYRRLKEDVDRSREMYEKRIPPEIRAARDYFHEELVRILADGDSDALGM